MIKFLSPFDLGNLASMRRDNQPDFVWTPHHSIESEVFLLERTEALYSKQKYNLLWVKSPGWLCFGV